MIWFSRYGANSIEVGHELLKLGDVYSQLGSSNAVLRKRTLATFRRALDIIELHYGSWHPLYSDTAKRLNQ